MRQGTLREFSTVFLGEHVSYNIVRTSIALPDNSNSRNGLCETKYVTAGHRYSNPW